MTTQLKHGSGTHVNHRRGSNHYKHKTWNVEKRVSKNPYLYEFVGQFNSLGEIGSAFELSYYSVFQMKNKCGCAGDKCRSKLRITEVVTETKD